MAVHKQIKRKELEEESRHKKKARQPLYNRRKQAAEAEDSQALARPIAEQASLAKNPQVQGSQRAETMRGLQQSYGNRYVQRVMGKVQAKLIVNPSGDQYESEADRVADAVTKASASNVQRQEKGPDEEELVATKRASDIQRQVEEEPEEEEEEEEPIQTKLSESQPNIVSKEMEADINTARSSGQPLPDSVRSSLEPQLGHDFSQVHIHTDTKANKLSQQLGARAFTTGHDIFFREGAYQPGSDSGRGLIAHELTHVMQQSAAPTLQRQAATETQAEAAAPVEANADVKEKAVSEIKHFADEMATKLDIAIIKGLLHGAALCYKIGMDSVADEALKKAAQKASAMLKRKITAFDPVSATDEMAKDLLEAAANATALGGDEKAIETALDEVRKRAETQLVDLVTELKETPSPDPKVAINVANLAGDVMMLGGDATKAVEALKKWAKEAGE